MGIDGVKDIGPWYGKCLVEGGLGPTRKTENEAKEWPWPLLSSFLNCFCCNLWDNVHS